MKQTLEGISGVYLNGGGDPFRMTGCHTPIKGVFFLAASRQPFAAIFCAPELQSSSPEHQPSRDTSARPLLLPMSAFSCLKCPNAPSPRFLPSPPPLCIIIAMWP
ncbi:unnamed protein product, partial [Discosporangium mesarthrocarpum]